MHCSCPAGGCVAGEAKDEEESAAVSQLQAAQRGALSTPKPSPRGPEFVIYVFQFASFAGVFVGVGRGGAGWERGGQGVGCAVFISPLKT